MNTTFVCSNCCSGVVLMCEVRHRFVASKKFSDCRSELLRLAKGGGFGQSGRPPGGGGQTKWTQVDGGRGEGKKLKFWVDVLYGRPPTGIERRLVRAACVRLGLKRLIWLPGQRLFPCGFLA